MIIFWDADDAAELKFKALKILQHPFLTGSFIIADHNPASRGPSEPRPSLPAQPASVCRKIIGTGETVLEDGDGDHYFLLKISFSEANN